MENGKKPMKVNIKIFFLYLLLFTSCSNSNNQFTVFSKNFSEKKFTELAAGMTEADVFKKTGPPLKVIDLEYWETYLYYDNEYLKYNVFICPYDNSIAWPPGKVIMPLLIMQFDKNNQLVKFFNANNYLNTQDALELQKMQKENIINKLGKFKQHILIEAGKLYYYSDESVTKYKDPQEMQIRRVFFNSNGIVKKIISMDSDTWNNYNLWVGLWKPLFIHYDSLKNYIIKHVADDKQYNGLFDYNTGRKIAPLTDFPFTGTLHYFRYEIIPRPFLFGRLSDQDKHYLFYYDLKMDSFSVINATKEFYFIVNADNLRLKRDADKNSAVTGSLSKGDKVQFITLGKKTELGSITGSWIKIKTATNKIGWCFDGYLTFIHPNN